MTSSFSSDDAVISTNDDATGCKLCVRKKLDRKSPFETQPQVFSFDSSFSSAMKLGYFKDDFVIYFAKAREKRAPLINRGYYTRVASFRKCIFTFISNGGKQIIALGAGFDTNYFHFSDTLPDDFKYLELDFPQVVSMKSQVLQRQPKFSKFIKQAQISDSGDITTERYCLRGVDLRKLEASATTILSCIDPTRPTLFLSECVLIYMSVEESSALLRWISETFSSAGMLLYEQIHPHDAFGQTMQKNLLSRGCPLLSLLRYPTIADQKDRFSSLGYTHVDALDMLQVWDEILDRAENRRIERLEMFDELEEWRLIQSHYCLVLAVVEKSQASDQMTSLPWSKLNFSALKPSHDENGPHSLQFPPSSKYMD